MFESLYCVDLRMLPCVGPAPPYKGDGQVLQLSRRLCPQDSLDSARLGIISSAGNIKTMTLQCRPPYGKGEKQVYLLLKIDPQRLYAQPF